jgi:hypothetical protein
LVLRIDPAQIPPAVELLDADDFGSFKAVIAVPDHTWVDPSLLVALAPDPDPVWRAQLEKMLSFAQEHGWIDQDGRIRAHVELIGDSAEQPRA